MCDTKLRIDLQIATPISFVGTVFRIPCARGDIAPSLESTNKIIRNMYGIFLSQQDQPKVKRRQPAQGEGRTRRSDEVRKTLEDLAIHSRDSGGSISSRDSFSTITTVESTRIQSIKSSDHSSKYSRYVPSEIIFTTSTPNIVGAITPPSRTTQGQQQQQRQRSNRTKSGSPTPRSKILNELDDFCIELSQEASKPRRSAELTQEFSKSRRSGDFYRKAYAKVPSRKASNTAAARRQVTDEGEDCLHAPGRIVTTAS